jgi:SAM-dependent methyltransferase
MTGVPATELVPACPLCGTPGGASRAARDRGHGLPGEFAFVRCPTCGLVRLSPRPVEAEIGFYYPEGSYYSYAPPLAAMGAGEPASPRDRAVAWVRGPVLARDGYPTAPLSGSQRALAPVLDRGFGFAARYSVRGFPRAVPGGGRALDVGSGSGLFLGTLARLGWDVLGVDTSRAAADQAQRSLGIEVRVGSFLDVDLPEAAFDHVRMGHVLEHFHDPLAALRRVTAVLAPGGMLFVETPNPDCLPARLLGDEWFPWEAPRHTFLFPPDALASALEEAGFEVQKLWTAFLPHVHQLAGASRPRAAVLDAAARLQHLWRPFNGDLLCCCARRPG